MPLTCPAALIVAYPVAPVPVLEVNVTIGGETYPLPPTTEIEPTPLPAGVEIGRLIVMLKPLLLIVPPPE